MSNKYILDGTWELCFHLPEDKKEIHTVIDVPSNVEPRLKELGLIEDYMPADDRDAMEHFSFVDDWTYVKNFDAPELCGEDKTELVFEGIDTIAQVYLNGELMCDCRDMHMEYRICVDGKLRQEGNELKVVIRSSELWAREQCNDVFSVIDREVAYFNSNTYLRKARHQWGWDNAPRLLTSGIIGSVYLEKKSIPRLEDVYVYTSKITQEYADVGVCWEYKTDELALSEHTVSFSLWDGEKEVYRNTRGIHFVRGYLHCLIPRDDVELWWPSGFGEPKLYEARLEVLLRDKTLSSYSVPFGIRTVKLERTEDMDSDGNGEFVFRVNGEKIFIRGTNWKPLSPLASEAHKRTAEGKALEELKNLHCNMVRIWGGGIYEDHSFFDFCDCNGIMVWQDFMFACEIPTCDDDYCALTKAEAIQIIKKLRNHASLAVWCGDNEDDMFITISKGGTDIVPSDIRISREILKQAVMYHDPYRPYVPSSPYISDRVWKCQQAETFEYVSPELHFYEIAPVFSQRLREARCRFIGEVGPIQMNAISKDKELFDREKSRVERLWDTERGLYGDVHQTDEYFIWWRAAGKDACLDYYGRDFGFDEWEDYSLALNVRCAEIFKEVIEYCRVQRWSKTGVLWWSLIDMWPMLFNYSVIDCKYNRKLPYYWIRQSQQEIALMAVKEKTDGALELYAVNDTLDTKSIRYSVYSYDKNGNKALAVSSTHVQERNSSSKLCLLSDCKEPSLYVLKWEIDGKEYVNHAFSGNASFETVRAWVEIIATELDDGDQIIK